MASIGRKHMPGELPGDGNKKERRRVRDTVMSTIPRLIDSEHAYLSELLLPRSILVF